MKRLGLYIFIFLAVLVCLWRTNYASAATTTVTFQYGANGYVSGQDNEIDSSEAGNPNTTYSAGGFTFPDREGLEFCSSYCEEILIRFPSLNITGTITDVQLTLNESGAQSAATNTIFAYKPTRANWDTNSVTWNDYSSGNAWTTPGGDFGSLIGSATDTLAGNPGTITLDLGASLSVSDLQTNGLLLQSNLPGFNREWFYSNEYVTTSSRPLLTVTYTPTAPSAPTGLTATASSSALINLAWASSTGATYYGIYSCTGSCTPTSTIATTTATTYANSGLTPSTLYTYAVNAVNAGGTSTLSSFASTTTFSSDVTPPSVSWVSPANGATVSSTTTITASSTDNIAVQKVSFYLGSISTSTLIGSSTIASGTQYSVAWNTTSAANGSSTLIALSADTSNNTSTASIVVNVENPPIITNATSTNVTTSTITISWTTNEAASSLVNYGTTISYGSNVSSSSLLTSHSLNLSSLGIGTAYHYQVQSTDAQGNVATSSDQIFTTQTLHPRLLLTPTLLQSLKSEAAASDTDWLALKAQADTYVSYSVPTYDRNACSSNQICYDYEGGGWLTAIEDLGLAYQVTGNVAYANQVIAIMNSANAVYKNSGTLTVDGSNNEKVTATGWTFNVNDVWVHITGGVGWTPGWYKISSVSGGAAILASSPAVVGTTGGQWANVEPESVDQGYPSRSAVFGLALAYDWVYDQLTPTEKTDTINTLNAWYDYFTFNDPAGAYDNTDPATNNYFTGHLLGFGAAGYATAGDNPRASEIENDVLNLFTTVESPCIASGECQGGYPVESYNYGPNNFERLMQYMQIVNENTGQDLGINTYASAMANSLIYNLKPNLWRSTDEGDFPGSYAGVLPGAFPLMLASTLGTSTQGGWMQWMFNNLATPPDGAGSAVQTPPVFEQFLYASSSRATVDYENTQPLSYFSPGDDHLYARSDWSTTAVWSSLAAGTTHWSDHQMVGAGNIAIQRGNDYLLINGGQWQGTDGVNGSPAIDDSDPSWRTNTLYFNDFGTYTPCDDAPACDTGNYVGGQGVWGTSNILASSSGANYAYTKTDLSSAYTVESLPNQTLASFTRSYAFLGDKYFVVWDRITDTSSSFVKKLFWHFNPSGVPTANTSTDIVQSTVGSSTLFLKTFLPTSPGSPVINIAGDGVNGISNTTDTLTYRAEVSDSNVSTTMNILTVMDADAAGSVMPTTTQLAVTGGNMVGTLIADPVTPRIVLFSTNGVAQTSTTYIASYSPLLTGRHLIFDMQPGNYDIYHDGTKIVTAASVASSGVLTFNSVGNSLFQIVPNGTVIPSNPTINSFSASSSIVASAGTSTLSWNITNASSVAITPGSFSTTTLIGSTIFHPTTTTSYLLTATNPNGTSTATSSITVDSAAPTIPQNLSANAASASEIDLSWNISTDNISVAGYDIYRNNSFLATTTNNVYHDTGLSASTLYSYAIDAFDEVDNISGQSSSTSATTQAASSGGGGGGGGSGGNIGVASGGGGGSITPSIQAATTTTTIATLLTNSTSVPALQAELNSLFAELVTLEAQANGGSASAPAQSSFSYTFTRNLAMWMTGNDVKQLQIFLIHQNKGIAAEKLKAHGTTFTFGPLTYTALVEFQKSVGIQPASGYFGAVTRAYVEAHE